MADQLKPFAGELDAPGLKPFDGQLDGEKPAKGFGSDVVTALKQGAQQLPGMVTGLADIPLGMAGLNRPISTLAERAGEATGFTPGKWADAQEVNYSQATKDSKAAIDAAWDDPNAGALEVAGAYLANPRATALNVVKSVPSMAAGGVVGRGLGAVSSLSGAARGAIGEGVVSAGQQMDQIDKSVDPQRAAVAALATGAGTAAIGYGAGRVAQRMGVADVDTLMAGRNAADAAHTAAAPGLAKSVALDAAQEALLEEAPQSALESGAQNLAEGKDVTEGMARNVVEGALAGGVMGAGAGAVGHMTPAQKMGIDENAGPLSKASAMAVNSGAHLALPAPTVTVDSEGNAKTAEQRNDELQDPGVVETGAMGQGRNSDPVEPVPETQPGLPALVYDTSPTGRMIAGDEGVRPETRAEAVNRQQVEGEQQAETEAARQARVDLGQSPFTPVRPIEDVAPMQDVPQIPLDTTPTGTLVVGADGVARPEIRSEQISRAQAAPEVIRNRVVAGRMAREAGPGHEVVAVEGGYAVRQVEDAAPRTDGLVPATRAQEIDAEASNAATSLDNERPQPTQAQKEAGNYAKGHIKLQGLDISIENPRSSQRSGQRPDGSTWTHDMSDHYGYIKRTVGADNEQVDVYVGPKPDSQKVFVVDQLDQQSGGFDEHKVMLGYDNPMQAAKAYRANFDKGWKTGPIKAMSMDEFKTWLKEGDTKAPATEMEQAMARDFERLYQHDIKQAIKAKRGPNETPPAERVRLSPLRAMLREVGVDPASAADITGERGLRANQRMPGTFRRGGKPLDELVTLARERGFLSDHDIASGKDNGGTRKLVELIQAELRGDQQVAVDQADEAAATRVATRASEDLQQQASAIGFDTTDLSDEQVAGALSRITRRRQQAQQRRASLELQQEVAVERAAILAADAPYVLDALDADIEIGENASLEDAMRALGFTEQEISDATANRTEGTRESGQGGTGLDGTSTRAAQRSATPGSPDVGSEEGLTRPSRSDVVAQQARAEQGEKALANVDAAAEKSARADREQREIQARQNTSSENFELGQSAEDGLVGQGGLFAQEATPDYSSAYEVDLFGNPVPTPARKSRPARSAGARVQGDVHAAADFQDSKPTDGRYFANTVVGSESQRQLGATLVQTSAQAAQATRYLYKSAVERLDGIITDKDGKPLAIVGGFKGAVSQAAVYPATLMAEAVRVPGAAYIWFSHNHPSGEATLSPADIRLNDSLTEVFRGSGIEPRGLLAVGRDEFAHVDENGDGRAVQPIPDSTKQASVPAIERQLGDGTSGPFITSPDAATKLGTTFYQEANKPGIMLLNARHGVVGWIPITDGMRGRLRATGGTAAIYRAVSQSNASAAILVHGGELAHNVPGTSVTAGENIAAALEKVDVRALDSINAKTQRSAAEQGLKLASGPVYSRDNGTRPAPSSEEIRRARMLLDAVQRAESPKMATVQTVRAAVRQLVNGLGALPNGLGRIVVATAAEIKADWEPLIGPVDIKSESQGNAQGFYSPQTKTVFLIADHIRQGDELGVAAHELMHKHGQTVLGKAGWDQLHGTISGWKNAAADSMERQVYTEAAARVEASGAHLSNQELFPYAVQVALEMGVQPNAVGPQNSVARWLATVRKALRQVWDKITNKPALFETQDLVNLAFGIAQMENPAHARVVASALTGKRVLKEESTGGTSEAAPQKPETLGDQPAPGDGGSVRQAPGPQFSRAAQPSSIGDLTPEQQKAWSNVAGFQEPPTLKERMAGLKANLGLRLRQGIVDQFTPIKDVSQEAYMQARLSKGSDGTMEAAMLYGKPFLRDGVPDVDVNDGGFAQVMASLKGEHDRFLMWVAAQRAERLKAEGKENLFTGDDISALKSLNAGRFADGSARLPVYAKALNDLNAFNDAVLKVAEQSGLIDKEALDLFKGQPYVPFYRVMEDGDMQGPRFSAGLVNQQAYKKLKGGTNQLNGDLLQNMLLNWSHLYSAAARNRAALATMDGAGKMGVAYPVAEGTKGAIKVMREGVAEHWAVEDPYLLEAIGALNYVPSPLIKPLAVMKQVLTFGVTVNPTFKIRNLIRDSLSAVAQADLSYNPLENVAKGWKATAKDSQTHASMLAGGGTIKFGTGESSDRVRNEIKKLGGELLDEQGLKKVTGLLRKTWDAYNELGDRTENVNRAALYDRLIEKGHSPLEANFMARDLMDFSMSGKWPVVRLLTQTVPFMNARLQGLYKLGRAAAEDPRRFGAMAAAVSLASLGLMAAYGDDDDWKKREDFDRDSYWWFKIGETAYRIPKPFELGSIGTIAERTAELMLNNEMTGARFRERLSSMVFQTFAMDPIPQAFKPLLDVYSNKDSFTKRAIEGQGDEKLRPQDRVGERTSEVARLLGQLGLPEPLTLLKGEYKELSPKQVDFLLRGYFSWVGSAAANMTDLATRPFLDRGERPAMRLKDTFLAGSFVESLPSGNSRYVSQLYDQARDVEQAWASYRDALKRGDTEKAAEIREAEAPLLRNRLAVENAKKQLTKLNQQARQVEANKLMPADQKRERLEQIEQQRDVVARRVPVTTD